MKCIVLCADSGISLSSLTKDTPKSLLSIRGKPIVEYIISKVELLENIDEIFIVTNPRFFKQFQIWVNNFFTSIPIKIINNSSFTHKNIVGAIKSLYFVVEKENIDDDILVIGGDNLFSFSLNEFIHYALTHKPAVVVGTYNLNGRLRPKKFGVVHRNKNNQITQFYEKPAKLNGSKLISLCLYFFPKEKLQFIKDYLVEEHNAYSPGNYISWLSKRECVYTFDFNGMWFDVGDIDSYAEAVCVF